MSVKVLKKISEKEACLRLQDKSKVLKALFISNIKKADYDSEKYYFSIKFRMANDTYFWVTYSFEKIDDYYQCKSLSKLFNLMKKFVGVNEYNSEGFKFKKEDIEKLILNKKFLATAEFRKMYGGEFPYIEVIEIY